MRRLLRHWAFWPLALALTLRLVAIGWGLPATDGWDNDGVAPRDVFPGLAASFTPGEYYTYPPLHLAVLAVLSSPVAAWGYFSTPGHALPDVVRTMLAPGPMTALALIARFVALVLSLATTWLVGDLARRTHGERAARAAAFAGAVNLGFTYYGKTSNLDVPCVFWTVLAVWLLVRARLEPARRLELHAALAVVAALTTKDQAYANFVLLLPVCLLASRQRAWLTAAAAGALGFAVASGALFNPRGFAARVAFLRGSASQDFGLYSTDLRGRIATLTGVLTSLVHLLGLPLLLLAGAGLGLALAKRRLPALLPALAMLSFFLFFNAAARRGEERFVLSHAALLAYYVGIAVARLPGRSVYAAPLCFLPALYRSVSLDQNLLQDPRYEVERWLAAHARPDDSIETYGLNVYLPRFPPDLHVVRVSSPDAPAHNPLPGVLDLTAPLSAIEERKPRFLVVPQAYTWRYRAAPGRPDGYVMPESVHRYVQSQDGAPFFAALYAGRLPYRPVLEASCDERLFARIVLHASVCEPVTVFERAP